MSRLAVDACLSRGRGFQESRLDSRARYAIAKSCGTLPSNLSADLEETVVTLIAPARSRPALSTRVHEPTGIQNWAVSCPAAAHAQIRIEDPATTPAPAI
jgi:hypothetical protein